MLFEHMKDPVAQAACLGMAPRPMVELEPGRSAVQRLAMAGMADSRIRISAILRMDSTRNAALLRKLALSDSPRAVCQTAGSRLYSPKIRVRADGATARGCRDPTIRFLFNNSLDYPYGYDDIILGLENSDINVSLSSLEKLIPIPHMGIILDKARNDPRKAVRIRAACMVFMNGGAEQLRALLNDENSREVREYISSLLKLNRSDYGPVLLATRNALCGVANREVLTVSNPDGYLRVFIMPDTRPSGQTQALQ